MGKYDKLFPKMSKDKKAERIQIIMAEYNKVHDGRAKEIAGTDSYVPKDMHVTIGWQKRGVDALDSALVGPFTINEVVSLLGMDYPVPLDKEALIKAMDKCMGVTRFELKEGKGNIINADFSDSMKADIKAFEDNDEKYILTRWDRFWGFFGIKTDHALAVETNIAAIESYKEKQYEYNKAAVLYQLKNKKDNMLLDHEDAYARMKGVVSNAKNIITGWNRVFFGDNRPKDYVLDNGKKVSAVSLCMAIMYQRGKCDFSSISSKQFIEMMKKDKDLRREAEELGAKISEIISNKEAAADKSYDEELKAMLKPENPKDLYITKAIDYGRLGKGQEEEKKRVFGLCSAVIKVREDMAKIFGKDDKVYGTKNVIEKDAEEKIKRLIKAVTVNAKVYDAIRNNDYDTAIKVSSAGKGDFSNYEEVLNQCGRNIKYIEEMFAGRIMRQEKMEELQLDDMENDNEL